MIPNPIGIRLERKKDASLLNWNLKRPYPPEKIRIPIPASSWPCIRVGEVVQTGQKIAVPISINCSEAVSIPTNRSGAEIGAVPTTINQKKIKVGTESQGPEGVSLHASMDGTVEKIAVFPSATGREIQMIEIRKHGGPNTFQFPQSGNWGSPDHHQSKENKGRGEPKAILPAEPRKGWSEIPAEELLKIFQHSGLVTTDPLMEPVHAKLKRHAGARTIIINGCEPEPYITCEQVLILSHPVEILKGAELLRKALGAVPIPIIPPKAGWGSAAPTTMNQKKIKVGTEKILFAIENCNLEMIELIKSKIYFLKWEHAEVRTMPTLYPQGLESTLLQAWFPGQEGKAVVFPASTAFAVYEAVAQQKPFYERVVTVGGECVVEPRSLWLPIGISFHDAIHACKGVMREPQKILMGGPMAGTAQKTAEVPVTAGTNAILALPKEVTKDETIPIPINRSGAEIGAAQTTLLEKNQKVWAEEPCIRCNACVDHCPVSLSPVMITLAAEQKEFSIAEEWNVTDCVECGNCAYVCPSKRPMLELIRLARALSRPAVTRLRIGEARLLGEAAHG